MITVHAPTLSGGETFTGTGRQTLDPHLLEAEVVEELNGAYTLTLSWLISSPIQVEVGDIIAAPTPAGRQGFRVVALDADSEQVMHATCHHVSFDIAANVIVDAAAINMTGSEALAYLLSHLHATHPFTTTPTSPLGYRTSSRWVRKSGQEALTGDDNGLLSRWGGEITRNNTVLSWSERRGKNTQVRVWEGKNLASMQVVRDHTTTCTRLLPVGFDGLTLPEVFVDSPLITSYPSPLVRVERFDDVRAVKDPEHPAEGELPLPEAEELLRETAARRFSEDHIDSPSLTIDVAMHTPESPDGLDNLHLGDTLKVTSKTYGVDVSARVTAYRFNPVTGKYVSLTIATTPQPVRGMAAQLRQIGKTARATVYDTVLQVASSTTPGNSNYHGSSEPVGAKSGDIWFKDDGSGHITIWVYKPTSQGTLEWVEIAGDINDAALTAELAQVREEIGQIDADVNTRIMDMQTLFDDTYFILNNQIDQSRQDAQDSLQTVTTGILNTLSQERDQLLSDISEKPDSDKIIYTINNSPETSRITGQRLHVSQNALIDNGVIKTAMIQDAAIVDAKIGSLDAAKITTGTLAAARIAAGSITSDKLTIANGFIKTAMISDAAITSAKIGSLDAGKITTGTLAAARIAAGSITADKLAANTIQVGLAGWNNTIRISPYSISWYDGSTLSGRMDTDGMQFWYGTRYVGRIGENGKNGDADVRGISNQIADTGDYISWSYKKTATDTVYTSLWTLDPKGRFNGQPGIHLGMDLYTHAWGFLTQGNREITLQDSTLTNIGTYPGWSGTTGRAKIVFHPNHIYLVTDNSYYNMTEVINRVRELIVRMNSLIGYFNQGWVKSIQNSGGNITWQYFSNTGLSQMPTNF